MIVQQSIEGGVIIAQDDNAIFLQDEDIARIIQVRYLFSRFDLTDLQRALDDWLKVSNIRQASLEEIMMNPPDVLPETNVT